MKKKYSNNVSGAMAADKKPGVVRKAQEYYLKKGEYVINARKAKRIRRAISRGTGRR